jgi:hypothetical protein
MVVKTNFATLYFCMVLYIHVTNTEIFSKDFFEFGSFLVYVHVMFQLKKKTLNLRWTYFSPHF